MIKNNEYESNRIELSTFEVYSFCDKQYFFKFKKRYILNTGVKN